MKMLDFVCRDCAHAFEELVFGDTVVQCPRCKSANVEQQLSACAVGGGGGGSPERCGPANSGFT